MTGCGDSEYSTPDGSETDNGSDAGKTSTDIGDLLTAATATGKLFGAAVDADLLSRDTQYASILASEFNYVTPENATKWGSIEPVQGEYAYEDADAIIDFAKTNGQAVKGHTLVWHEQTPSWVNSSMSAEDLGDALKSHIETTMTRYKGRVRAWDVVNEAVDTSTESGYTESVFYKTLGPGYIADAFWWAREADPEALLFYNEVGIERMGAKSDFTYALMRDLIESGVPIDGIGFQSHVSTHRYPSLSDLRENIRRFADLGLRVNISELDARTLLMPGSLEDRWYAQRIAFQQVVGACVVEPGCEGVTLWGFQDGYSWINDEGEQDDPLIFDRSYEKKPAYYGVLDGLGGRLPAAGENQIENGDFSDGSASWRASGGSLTVDDAVDRNGRAACVSERAQESDGAVQENLVSRLGDGGPFSFSAYIRLTGNEESETVSAILIVQEEGGDTEALDLALRPIPAGEWAALAGYFSLGFDNAPLEISLDISGPSAGVELCVAEVTVLPLSPE